MRSHKLLGYYNNINGGESFFYIFIFNIFYFLSFALRAHQHRAWSASLLLATNAAWTWFYTNIMRLYTNIYCYIKIGVMSFKSNQQPGWLTKNLCADHWLNSNVITYKTVKKIIFAPWAKSHSYHNDIMISSTNNIIMILWYCQLTCV